MAKDVVIKFRVTTSEQAMIAEGAAYYGRSVTDFARGAVLDAASAVGKDGGQPVGASAVYFPASDVKKTKKGPAVDILDPEEAEPPFAPEEEEDPFPAPSVILPPAVGEAMKGLVVKVTAKHKAKREAEDAAGVIPLKWQCGCSKPMATRMFNHAISCTRCGVPYPGQKAKS